MSPTPHRGQPAVAAPGRGRVVRGAGMRAGPLVARLGATAPWGGPSPGVAAFPENRHGRGAPRISTAGRRARRRPLLPLATSSTAGRDGAGSPQPSCNPVLTPDAFTPLLDAVLARGAKPEAPFHIPGHKRGTGGAGSGAPPPLSGLARLAGPALAHDLTELAGLGVLGAGSGPVGAAQAAAALAAGAAATRFLVNGASVGVHAAVWAAVGAARGRASEARGGPLVLAPRNTHSCVFHAAALAGARLGWLAPEVAGGEWGGLAHCLAPATLAASLERAAAAGDMPAAVVIVSPTYFGALADVPALASACHAHDIPLIVDEAHGAHLGADGRLPPSALAGGADVVVQSAHKAKKENNGGYEWHGRCHIWGGVIPMASVLAP